MKDLEDRNHELKNKLLESNSELESVKKSLERSMTENLKLEQEAEEVSKDVKTWEEKHYALRSTLSDTTNDLEHSKREIFYLQTNLGKLEEKMCIK